MVIGIQGRVGQQASHRLDVPAPNMCRLTNAPGTTMRPLLHIMSRLIDTLSHKSDIKVATPLRPTAASIWDSYKGPPDFHLEYICGGWQICGEIRPRQRKGLVSSQLSAGEDDPPRPQEHPMLDLVMLAIGLGF